MGFGGATTSMNPMNTEAYGKLSHIFQEQGKFKKAMIYSGRILKEL